MDVAVIGGGISGLTLTYQLLKKGAKVTLYEKTGVLGGQASSFDFGGINIEGFYHFICGADEPLFQLIKELGINSHLHWEPTRTAFFYDGKLYPFCNPIDLIKFTPISFYSRLRYGFHIYYSKLNKKWEKYDDVDAVSWLTKHIGKKAYDVLWHPLLKIKFGKYYDKLSAAWIWHRIHRVASSRKSVFSKEYMGYLEKGSQVLIDALEKQIKQRSGNIRLKSKVQQILFKQDKITGLLVNGQDCRHDVVISTVPLPLLEDILPPEANNLKNKLNKIKFVGVVCMILKLKHPITENFWLNLNDKNISFNGIIEYTNINKADHLKDISIAYIPYYLAVDEERFKYTNEQLFEEYCQAIKVINPQFSSNWVIDYRVFRHKYAQAVCTTGFLKLMEGPRTEFSNLYFTDSTQIYPQDRCLSGMVEKANEVVEMIQNDHF